MFFLLKGSWNGTLLPYAWPTRFEYGLTSLPNRPGSKTYIGALILSGSWGGPCSWHTYAYIKYSTHVYTNWHKLNQCRHTCGISVSSVQRMGVGQFSTPTPFGESLVLEKLSVAVHHLQQVCHYDGPSTSLLPLE